MEWSVCNTEANDAYDRITEEKKGAETFKERSYAKTKKIGPPSQARGCWVESPNVLLFQGLSFLRQSMSVVLHMTFIA